MRRLAPARSASSLFVPRAPHSGQEWLFPGIHTMFLR